MAPAPERLETKNAHGPSALQLEKTHMTITRQGPNNSDQNLKTKGSETPIPLPQPGGVKVFRACQ